MPRCEISSMPALHSLLCTAFLLTCQALTSTPSLHLGSYRGTTSIAKRTRCEDRVSWSSSHQLSIGGATRSYHVLQPDPALAHSSVPAIMMLHGYGSNAMGFACEGSMAKEGRSKGYMMVYLEGTLLLGGEARDQRLWNSGSAYGTSLTYYPEKADDVAYVKAVIQGLVAHLHVDPDRIFVAGISNGGSMSLRVSCELADLLAGAAVVHGSLEFRNGFDCASGQCTPDASGYEECAWDTNLPSCKEDVWVEQLPKVFECNSVASMHLPRIMFEGGGNSWLPGGVTIGLGKKRSQIRNAGLGITQQMSDEGNYPPSEYARKYYVNMQTCKESRISFLEGSGSDRTECTSYLGCTSKNLTMCMTSNGGDWWYGPPYDVETPCKHKDGDKPKECTETSQTSTYGSFSHSVDITQQVLAFFQATGTKSSL
eukprot:TRINITY_DN79311_c0_g1_i1.p1 TRINITY_DN79311_c0_g1~~TRINITY_DN79311_c0_g1_i1.p1  ORF type:complete len:426 (+),score=56.04 TRINITY_DN79311_c0_g1_i1:68-1345(+)